LDVLIPEGRRFFFVEKKQKTSPRWSLAQAVRLTPSRVVAQPGEVFWFFFSKKNFLLCLAFFWAFAAHAEKVTIGTTNVATDAGFFIAEQRGYFRDVGIEPEFVRFASAAGMIAPLGTGQLDVGSGTVAAGLYNAVSRGVNLRIVADKGSIQPGYEFSTLVIRKDLVDSGRYHGLADLKGLTIATAAQGAGSESSLNEALKKGGLAWPDVNVVYMGFPEMLAALRNKGIDGGVTNEPTLQMVLGQGIGVHASTQPIYPGQQTAVVLYAENFMHQRHDLALAFMVAYVHAVRDYNGALKNGTLSGPGADAIIAILTQSTAVKDPAVYREMTAFAVNPDGRVNVTALDNDLAFFRSRGLVTDQKLSAADLVDQSYVTHAAGVLGAVAK
jgi:NitT/TauT family transport system substrate-binding protein